MNKLVLSLITLFWLILPLSGQIYNVDARPDKTIVLAIRGDATFTASKMKLSVREVTPKNGYSVSQNDIQETFTDTALQSAAGSTLIYTSAYVEAQIVADAMASAGSLLAFGPTSVFIFYAQIIYYQQVVETHTLERNYVFEVPVEGDYTINVWVPGDWDKPVSMIKVFSAVASGGGATLNQVYNYDQTNVSDRVFPINLHLQAGAATVKVAVGSGSLLTHNAGHLNDAYLDNSFPLTWTRLNVPLTTKTINPYSYLPIVGSTNYDTITYTPNYNIPNMINGSVVYSNPHPALFIQPLPSNISTSIQVYGEITDELAAQIGTWNYTNLDVSETGTSEFDGITGKLYFIRKPDFASYYKCRAIYHPY